WLKIPTRPSTRRVVNGTQIRRDNVTRKTAILSAHPPHDTSSSDPAHLTAASNRIRNSKTHEHRCATPHGVHAPGRCKKGWRFHFHCIALPERRCEDGEFHAAAGLRC